MKCRTSRPARSSRGASSVAGDDFVVELGLKSEGILERSEFDEPENVKIGDEVACCSKTSKATPGW
jgi:ribosomal protein S1